MIRDKSTRQVKVSHIENTASRSQPNADRSNPALNRSSRRVMGANNMLSVVEGPINIAAIPATIK